MALGVRVRGSRDQLIRRLDAANIESRPVWKPMHLQRLYAESPRYGGRVAEDLFRRGICLPSSSSLSPEDQLRVIGAVRNAAGAGLWPELETNYTYFRNIDPPAALTTGSQGPSPCTLSRKISHGSKAHIM